MPNTKLYPARNREDKTIILTLALLAALGLGVLQDAFASSPEKNITSINRLTHIDYSVIEHADSGSRPYKIFNKNEDKIVMYEYPKTVFSKTWNGITGRGTVVASIDELKAISSTLENRGDRTAYETVTHVLPEANSQDLTQVTSIIWSALPGEENILYATFKNTAASPDSCYLKKINLSDLDNIPSSWTTVYDFSSEDHSECVNARIHGWTVLDSPPKLVIGLYAEQSSYGYYLVSNVATSPNPQFYSNLPSSLGKCNPEWFNYPFINSHGHATRNWTDSAHQILVEDQYPPVGGNRGVSIQAGYIYPNKNCGDTIAYLSPATSNHFSWPMNLEENWWIGGEGGRNGIFDSPSIEEMEINQIIWDGAESIYEHELITREISTTAMIANDYWYTKNNSYPCSSNADCTSAQGVPSPYRTCIYSQYCSIDPNFRALPRPVISHSGRKFIFSSTNNRYSWYDCDLFGEPYCSNWGNEGLFLAEFTSSADTTPPAAPTGVRVE